MSHQVESIRSGGRLVATHGTTWPGVRLSYVARTSVGRQDIRHLSEHHAVFVNMRGRATKGEQWLDGRSAAFEPRWPGDFTLVPKGTELRGWDEGDPDAACLSIAVEDHRLASAVSDTLHELRATPILAGRDRRVLPIAKLLVDASNPAADYDTGYHDAILNALLNAVLLHSSTSPRIIAAKGGLPPRTLSRILEQIEATLGEPTDVEALAMTAGISRRHLERCFRQSTGKPLHAFVVSRRIELAKRLMNDPRSRITDVAHDSGFRDLVRFSTAFSAAVGVSPREWRLLMRT